LVPVALVFSGSLAAAGLGAAAWLLLTIAYLPMVRLYRLSPLWSPALPLAALFYLGATLHSALAYWRGRGGAWKGRIQDARASG
ncbi:MAG: glycosyltransferase, partial [Bryobacteraceae bacterium]